jgi:peptidoglycan/xylan/chitin deacetylase (PgdA/CDA1 family)
MTFDDGPSPFTLPLLQMLDEEKVPVTFFVLGSQVADPKLQPAIREAYARGHQIGVHTYSHPNLTMLTADQVRDEMVSTDNVLRETIGASPFYMRPPFGDVNEHTLKVLKTELDYEVVQWNVDSNDWRVMGQPKQFKDVARAFTRTLGRPEVTPTMSAFISLQHDILDFSVNQTRKIIQDIREKGFQFVVVSDCLGSPKPQYRNAPNGVFRTGVEANRDIPKADPTLNPLIHSQNAPKGSSTNAKTSSASSTTLLFSSSWTTTTMSSTVAMMTIAAMFQLF